MKYIMYLGVLMCCCFGYGQCSQDTMEFNERKFSIEPYKDWEVDNTYSSPGSLFFKKGACRIKVYGKRKIEISFTDKPEVFFQMYDETTGVRISSGQRFFDMYIGKGKYYDKNGDLEKEVDMDAPFKFSIEDLVQKFKIEFDIDLMIPSQDISIDRVDFPKSKYFIIIQKGKSRTARRIEVDGATGKILSDEVKTQPEKFSDEWIKQSKTQSRSDISLIEEEKKQIKVLEGGDCFNEE